MNYPEPEAPKVFMAKVGNRVVFHGAYKSKRAAVRHEKKGEFIIGRKIEGKERFLLLSRKVK